MNRAGDVGCHDSVARKLVPLQHGLAESNKGLFFGSGRNKAFGECQCEWHSFLLWSSRVLQNQIGLWLGSLHIASDVPNRKSH